ncbi:CHAP domain-containing protein [Podospora didyma]|uniref:CHAP domain-containing protein n=1 Tax=Podospora didyma TaxID=330526 RepID=A0AAE0K2C0_9PEZI|nr:CHAP domain-containing protein [Podospora didyma]
MKLTLTTTILHLAAFFTTVTAYPISGNDVRCRAGPGTNHDIKKVYSKGEEVKISCQTAGESIEGNNIWDKTDDGCYVADYYVKTGTDGYVTKKCSSSGAGGGGSTSKIPGPIKDDYPSAYDSGCGNVADKWHFFRCECTSFVAFRINERLGVDFTNWYKGEHWGDAGIWDEAARKSDVKIDNNPKPGSIAQTNSGRSGGHVAWVAAVHASDGTVTVEEYNFNNPHKYGKRTVSKGTFKYIHIKV